MLTASGSCSHLELFLARNKILQLVHDHPLVLRQFRKLPTLRRRRQPGCCLEVLQGSVVLSERGERLREGWPSTRGGKAVVVEEEGGR